MVKTILVVGAAGFIGSHLTKKLLAEKYNIIVLKRSADKLDRLDECKEQLKFYNSDQGETEKAFLENEIDLVINLATRFGRDQVTKPSDIVETNVLFAIKLTEIAIKYKVKYLFNLDSSLAPNVNLYAFTKNVTKEILREYFSDDIKIYNIRLEYVYGSGDDLSKLIPMVVDKLKRNQLLEVTKGEQNLDFLNISDLTDAFVYLLKNSQLFPEKFVEVEIGSGQATKIKDLILIIKKELQSTSEIKFGAVTYRKNEHMHSVANISTMKGWKPKVKLSEGIKELIR